MKRLITRVTCGLKWVSDRYIEWKLKTNKSERAKWRQIFTKLIMAASNEHWRIADEAVEKVFLPIFERCKSLIYIG